MKAGRVLSLLIRFSLTLSIVISARLISLPGTSKLWAEIFNAGHVVLMGGFSLILLGLSAEILGGRFSNRLSHYLVAFSVTVSVGGLLEIAQIPGPRVAAVLDVMRDAAGAFCFLSLYMTWDRSLPPFQGRWGPSARGAITAAALGVLVVTWLPTMEWIVAFYHRDRMFPTLCTFDSRWERLFWTTRSARLEPTLPPAGWPGAHDGLVGRMISQPSRRSGFAINQAYPDWSHYHFLQVSVYLDLDTPVAFSIQVEDSSSQGTTGDRFTYVREIDPGFNIVAVPLEMAQRLPDGRRLDFKRIQTVYFFTSDTLQTITLYLDNIKLR